LSLAVSVQREGPNGVIRSKKGANDPFLKGRFENLIKNPFNHEDVERNLFNTYKHGPLQGRRTRTFLRKMARYVEHSYEIGYRDAAAEKPLIPQEDLHEPTEFPLKKDLYQLAYAAYESGYRDGKLKKKEVP